MEERAVMPDGASGRQWSVAVTVAGLSWAAAAAGRADWRMLLAVLPVWLLWWWALMSRRRRGALPVVVELIYKGWAVVLVADVLRRAADRIQFTGGSRGARPWLVLLFVLPLLWMGWKKSAPFFRAVEILWLAMAALLAVLLLLVLPRVEWSFLGTAAFGWQETAEQMTLVFAPALFSLPYIYKERGEGICPLGMTRWLLGLGVMCAALAAATAGVLSPAVSKTLAHPFFVATGVLGESARGEGLVSDLWLLTDLTAAGLLCRVWGERRWPAVAAALGGLLAVSAGNGFFARERLAAGTGLLLLVTLLAPARRQK